MNAADWARYSALLDQALDLPPAERAPWLEALRARDAATGAALAGLLQKAEAAEAAITHHSTTPRAFQQWVSDAAQSQQARQAGQSFGPWQLLRPLGAGGMGEVWLAARRDGLYEGQAALKFIRSGLAAAQLADRFARERRVLARLNHPGIARLLDAGVAEQQPFLVLEYVPGMPLLEHARMQALGVVQRVRLLLAAAQAVEYAHGQLVAHRDLKPSNLLVTPQGEVKLLDFGIATLLDDDAIEGDHTLTKLTGRALTPGYAAPEQIAGEPAGTAADVFALGVLLFELLAGSRPFAPAATSRAAIEHAVLHEPPLSLRAALAQPASTGRATDAARGLNLAPLLEKALRRKPDHRYVSVGAFAEDLQRWLDHRPLVAAATPWRTRTRLWLQRNKVLAASGSLATLALLVGLGVALWQRQQALDEAKRSETLVAYFTDMFREASPFKHNGEWPTALTLLQKSFGDVSTRFKDDPRAEREILKMLFGLFAELARNEEAEKAGTRALALMVEQGDAQSMDYAQLAGSMANTKLGLGKPEEALPLSEASLPILERELPAGDRDILIVQGQLAKIYNTQGRYAEAERGLRRVMQDTRRYHGDKPELVVEADNDLGTFLGYQRRVSEALEIYDAMMPTLSQLPPNLERNVQQFRANWLSLRTRAGLYAGNEQRLLEVQKRQQAILGADSDMELLTLNHLGNFYRDTGEYLKAAAVSRERIAALTRRFGEADRRVPAEQLVLLNVELIGGLPLATARERFKALRPKLDAALSQPTLPAMDSHEMRSWIAFALSENDIAREELALAQQLARDPKLRRPQTPVAHGLLQAQLAVLDGKPTEALPAYRASLAFWVERGDRATLTRASAAARLAYVAALAKQPEAKALLAEARSLRPAELPAAHPFGAALDYVAAVIDSGSPDSAASLAAYAALNRAYRRPEGDPIPLPLTSFWL